MSAGFLSRYKTGCAHREITESKTFLQLVGLRSQLIQALRLHLEEATVYAFEFRPVAQSCPA